MRSWAKAWISSSVTVDLLGQHDDGVDLLAPGVVGDADDRDLLTASCNEIALSTSAEYTFSPPVTIMSFTRSTRNR